MTVFKGYMKILKKNIGLVIIYLVIFLLRCHGSSGSCQQRASGRF